MLRVNFRHKILEITPSCHIKLLGYCKNDSIEANPKKEETFRIRLESAMCSEQSCVRQKFPFGLQ